MCKSPLAQAIRYALRRIPKARPYLGNGQLELDNNTAERAVKPVAIGRKNWMFAGSQGGGKAMAIPFTLIKTAMLNDVDPQAWLTWGLAQIADHKITRYCLGVTLPKQRNRHRPSATGRVQRTGTIGPGFLAEYG
ncbi:IS66 family transposase [Pseudaestuariivita rosea]|uniref:IS66 family transposase n=1 Tax=Pseudaestuariivita rosea TaxID=2763263 RepID=UPI003AF7E0FC